MSEETFGKYLNKLRTSRGLTTKQLEIKSGVSNSYISQLENNKRVPKPAILKKLSNALNVSYDELMMKAGYLTLDKKLERLTPDQYQSLIEALVKISYPYAVERHYPTATTEESHRLFFQTILRKLPEDKLSEIQADLIKSIIEDIDIYSDTDIVIRPKLPLKNNLAAATATPASNLLENNISPADIELLRKIKSLPETDRKEIESYVQYKENINKPKDEHSAAVGN